MPALAPGALADSETLPTESCTSGTNHSRLARPAAMTALVTARRAVVPALLWGAGLGIYVSLQAIVYTSTYKTPAERAKLSSSLSGTTALVGPGRDLQTAIEPPRTGDATVLLVEDQDGVRRAARRILEQAGYRVVEAADGVDALARTDLARVDLLLTDVVMPGGLSGHDLALAVQERFPRVRVLYMSGYTADIIARRGMLEEGLSLLQKPFDAESLLTAVATALDLIADGAAV